MSEKPWLTFYPSSIPSTLPSPRDPTLVELHHRCCERFRELPALENLGTRLSYGEWQRLSQRFAHTLHHRLGMTKGERLAIMLPNLLQYPVVLMGALKAGLTVVNINPLFTPRELAQELKESEPAAIVLLDNFLPLLEEIPAESRPAHIITTEVGDLCPTPKRQWMNWVVRRRSPGPRPTLPNTFTLTEILRQGRETTLDIRLAPDDLVFLQFTGGTTGFPKGVMLTHSNILANIEQTRLWLTCQEWPRHMKEGAEILVTALPLYHIFALTANLCIGMVLGVHNYLITDPRNLRRMVKLLDSIPFTCLTGVNTLFDHLLRERSFARLDFSTLKLTLAGGMPMHRSTAERWFEVTGCPVIEGYGLTEASPVVTLNPLDIESFSGSIGLPLPGTECALVDDDRRRVAAEQSGELWVRGPQVMQGYWKHPGETQRVLTEDGWLKTGDIATMDPQGFFYIVGRKKDMILVSGFNVYPHEVEEVINSHPGVAECAAIGIPDEQTGEAVKVFVVRSDPNLDEQALKAWCRANLTPYKRPHQIVFRDSLPKSSVGKILRRELRESP